MIDLIGVIDQIDLIDLPSPVIFWGKSWFCVPLRAQLLFYILKRQSTVVRCLGCNRPLITNKQTNFCGHAIVGQTVQL